MKKKEIKLIVEHEMDLVKYLSTKGIAKNKVKTYIIDIFVLLYISKYDWISGIFIILANTIKIKYKVNVKF